MKACKIVSLIALSFAVIALSANDIKDTWFETLYEGTKNALSAGMSASKFAKGNVRILFVDYPLPVSSEQKMDPDKAKQVSLKAMRGSADAEYVKKTGCIIIYNFITTDHKVFKVVITADDL